MIAVDTEWWQIAIGLFIYGFGVGLATAQLTGVVLADVPVEQSGQASGTQSTSRQFGSALGIAILGTILFSSLGTQLDRQPAGVAAGCHAHPRSSNLVVDSAGAAIPALEKVSPEIADIAARRHSATRPGTRRTRPPDSSRSA